MTLNKVTEQVLQAIVEVASNVVHISSELDVSTWYGAHGRIRMGRATGTAFTSTSCPKFKIQGTYKASPDNQDWVTLSENECSPGASIASSTTSSGDGAGSSAVTLAAGTNFAARDKVFFHHTTPASCEWHDLESVSGAVITLVESLVIEQVPSTVRDQAEEYLVSLDLTSIKRIRFVADGAGSGQAFFTEAVLGAVDAL